MGVFVTILAILILAYGVRLTLKYLFPLIRRLFNYVLRDKKLSSLFMYLITFSFIVWAVSIGFRYLISFDNKYLNYLWIFDLLVNLTVFLVDYLKWLILVAFVILGLANLRKKMV